MKNASSAIYTSSLVNRSSLTVYTISPAMVIIDSRVMPSSIEVSGVVFMTPFLTMKTFSPVPSAT